MAIFASTTLGSSDPSRAMSIKALEARAQALAATQAKQEMPTSLPSPWQGAGYLANTAADAFATRRADQAAAARRQDLANIMGGVGPEGPNPQQLAGITSADPDIGKLYAQQAFTARQNAADIQSRKEMAVEKYKQDEAAAVSQEQRLGARPQTDAGKLKQDLTSGRLSQEEYDAALKKLNAGSPAEQKLNEELQNKNIDLQSSAGSLEEAAKLLDQGIYSGGGAGVKGSIGNYVPGALQGVTGTDPETTKRNERFNQIMSAEVLPILSALKGSASDKDMQWAMRTINDPSSNLETKRAALNTLRSKVKAHLEQSNKTLGSLGSPAVKVESPSTGPPAAAAAPAAAGGGDPKEKARQAIAAGAPRDKVIERLKAAGIDPSGL